MHTIVQLIANAKHPVMLAGYGCEKYRAAFPVFADIMDMPVLLTWRAMDLLPADNFYNAGRPGMIGQPEAHKRLMKADLVLCIGARLDVETVAFDYAKFAPRATKIVVDIDKAELDKLPADWVKVQMDAGVFMETMAKVEW